MTNPRTAAGKDGLKRLLSIVAPKWTTAMLSARARVYSQKVAKSWGCEALNHKLIERLGTVVQEGPFAGLVLSPMTCEEHLAPFLLGVYESELDHAWDIVWDGTYSQIVDVGAKFGYYAVGLARRYSDAHVVAFDTDWWARAAVQEMVRANDVHNVEVKSFCDRMWLTRHLRQASLIISDCEGYEATLFDVSILDSLATATLIIETHDCFAAGVTDTLLALFTGTHAVHVFNNMTERRTSTQQLDYLSDNERQLAEHEVRPEQSWLLCLPRTGPNGHLSRRAADAATSPSFAPWNT